MPNELPPLPLSPAAHGVAGALTTLLADLTPESQREHLGEVCERLMVTYLSAWPPPEEIRIKVMTALRLDCLFVLALLQRAEPALVDRALREAAALLRGHVSKVLADDANDTGNTVSETSPRSLEQS